MLSGMVRRFGLGTAGGHRYGIVLVVAIVLVVFLILAPDRAGSRVVAVILSGLMLFVVLTTSRSGDRTRRELMAAGLVIATVVIVIAALLGAPKWTTSTFTALLLLATLGQLVHGLTRLLRHRGVTIPAVAGALAVYLLVGVVFSVAVSIAAKLSHGAYFAQGTDGTESQHVYFSFTTLTTTGYGDLSPATRGGRALAVLEMLTGQIYLVTVISLLVGNLRRRGEADASD
jgi:hypothetical protein